jgi:hypothetical protein
MRVRTCHALSVAHHLHVQEVHAVHFFFLVVIFASIVPDHDENVAKELPQNMTRVINYANLAAEYSKLKN